MGPVGRNVVREHRGSGGIFATCIPLHPQQAQPVRGQAYALGSAVCLKHRRARRADVALQKDLQEGGGSRFGNGTLVRGFRVTNETERGGRRQMLLRVYCRIRDVCVWVMRPLLRSRCRVSGVLHWMAFFRSGAKYKNPMGSDHSDWCALSEKPQKQWY